MIDDSDTSDRPTDESTAADSGDRGGQWQDTIDDWNAVLEDDSGDEDSTPSTTETSRADEITPTWSMDTTVGTESADTTVESVATDRDDTQFCPVAAGHCPEFDRIEPISDPLLQSMVKLLPAAWLEDTEIQQLLQWVVYAYIEETDPTQSTPTRIQTAIEHGADQTDLDPETVQLLCTTSLYRGSAGAPADTFQSDLKKIQRHLTSVF